MKADEFNPLGDRLLVRPTAAEQVTAGGVHLPAMAQEKPLTGEVIAIGGDVPSTSPAGNGVKVGDSVLYSKYGGVEVSTESGPHVILRFGDVLGTVG